MPMPTGEMIRSKPVKEERSLIVGHPEAMGCAPLLGLNMHPKWLGGGRAEDFLFPLRERELNVLEFTLNLSSPDWPEMCSLIEEGRRLGFGVTFHAPYKGP